MSTFISAFVAFFVIVDPLGTATVFAALTGREDAKVSRGIAIRAVLIAICVMLGFAFAGEWMLHRMGISLPAFRIAGGLLLFVTAFRMLMGSHDAENLNSDKSAYGDRSHLAVFPLAIPMLAGPGSMTAAILHMSSAGGASGHLIVAAAIIVVEILALCFMLMAGQIVRMMGTAGSSLLARLMGVLLAAMAVQFIADGINGFLGDM